MIIISGPTQEAEKEEDSPQPACQETWSKAKRKARCQEDGGDEEKRRRVAEVGQAHISRFGANPPENLHRAGKNNLTITVGLHYDGREHSRRITKEMQNCIDEKSILAVLEQIHSKLPMEQRKLWETVGGEVKVGVSDKKSSLLHSWHLISPRQLVSG